MKFEETRPARRASQESPAFSARPSISGVVLTLAILYPAWLSAEVSFSRDILPVLSDRCFHCHGPDENHREADLRLDVEKAAKADLGGRAAIVGGRLEDSELWRRITSKDEDEVMPPADSHRKPLTQGERAAIKQWILAGAKWGKHWSFEPISRPKPPTAGHPVDAFIKAKLAEQGLTMSRRAPWHTQLRRLSFDLTGLSPPREHVGSGEEESDEAWQAAIERSLQSPRHAERMAMWWLDAARYSDSDGFQQDATRQNWPWRDWVIRQFQENKSFRDFTIEQFAGDLLPDATDEQRLATCFHRNHMTNGEGGRDPEESRIDYVIDRVNTTGTVWLGLTLGCVQCHSHKFDPISQREYYSLNAFFNNIDEDGRAGTSAKPYLSYKSDAVEPRIAEMAAFAEQCREVEAAGRKEAERRFIQWLEKTRTQPEDYQTWRVPTPKVSGVEGTEFRVEEDQTVQTFGATPRHDDYRVVMNVPNGITRVTGFRIEVLPHETHVGERFSRDGNGEFALTSVLALVRRAGSPSETQLDVAKATADLEADKNRTTDWDKRYGPIAKTLNDDARDGWTTDGAEKIEPHVGVFELAEAQRVAPGDQFIVVMRHRSTHGHANIGRFRVAITSEFGETVRQTDGGSPVAELLEGDEEDVPDALRKRLLDQYLLSDAVYQLAARKLARATSQLNQLKKEAAPRRVMVLAEREKRRETHVLVRGVWDSKGDVVQPGVLSAVLDWPDDKVQSRLDFAQWIVADDNPLTPRVVVNHLWQMMFGRGLVRTPEDFGLQGDLPTHPDLLDYLAVELVENDWDLQHILRLIATSDTYRQNSALSAELLELDPENRLLARAPRFRLPAWMIRDNALHVSGLLNPAVGGPPTMPYQPPGVWSEITMGRFRYQPSLGPAQYRRTVYAFWRRSSAPAFLFDSAQRRVCEVGVRRTNTPLHALTLMNDETMLEAARALADLVAREAGDKSTDQWRGALQHLSLRVLSRELKPSEIEDARRVWHAARKTYESDPQAAAAYCDVGQRPSPRADLAPQTAAWMTVAVMLLNLDEAITHE